MDGSLRFFCLVLSTRGKALTFLPGAMATPPRATTVAAAVHRIQLALVDSASTPEPRLLAATSLLSRPDYEDVVTERNISGLCGDPRCPHPLPAAGPRKGRYHISLREHRVYDLEEAAKYCSDACLVASRAFAAVLEAERVSDMSQAKIERVLRLFEGVKSASTGEVEELKFEKLRITEKEAAGGGQVSLDEWMGPAGAIEGYVPQLDRNRGSGPTPKTKSVDDVGVSDTDFTSSVIVSDDCIVPPTTPSEPLLDVSKMVKQMEDVVLEEKKRTLKKTSFKSQEAKQMGKADNNKSQEFDFSSSIVYGDQANAVHYPKLPAFSQDPAKELAKEVEDRLSFAEPNGTVLKSSLKTSSSRSANRSVTWADEKKIEAVGGQHTVTDTSFSSQAGQEEEIDSSLRLASAEACAAALIQAAEAVSLGESEAVDAVSEAGILIMPQPQHNQKEQSEVDEDMFEFDQGIVKWPKKTVLLDTDMFEVEDSWHDTPPEGFSLTLSSFSTIWMAIFGWITCASLAYIYGGDDRTQDDFLVVNGREYPRKIVLRDGKSSEIRQTIEACIGRAMSGLVLDLRLPLPVSTLEKAVGCLLDTMSFVETLPPFRTKQWHVIVLLFIDALSVHRLPSLTPYMMGRSLLINKVLTAAQLTGEEYESIRDILLPLGRVPQFSTHSGG